MTCTRNNYPAQPLMLTLFAAAALGLSACASNEPEKDPIFDVVGQGQGQSQTQGQTRGQGQNVGQVQDGR